MKFESFFFTSCVIGSAVYAVFREYMKEQKKVEKLKILKAAGKNKFQCVFDFDQTISKYYKSPGVRNKTCHGVFPQALPEEFAKEEKRCLDTYYPIEIDPTLSLEYKIEKMQEWWQSVHTLAIEYGLQKEKLIDAVKESDIVIRKGFREMVDLLEKHNIPFLLMSAGVADVVEIKLQQANLWRKNMTVISNKCVWNKEGILVDFASDIIHSFNKNATSKIASAYWSQYKNRPNVLLVGDSQGDVDMTKGVPYVETVLKLGFLNKNVDARLNTFQSLYDELYFDDPDMSKVLEIVKQVCDASS